MNDHDRANGHDARERGHAHVHDAYVRVLGGHAHVRVRVRGGRGHVHARDRAHGGERVHGARERVHGVHGRDAREHDRVVLSALLHSLAWNT